MNNDLALINSMAHKNYSAGEVYIFSVVLCDNDVDKDFEYFDSDALEKLAGMFVGVMGIYDSDPFKENQNPRIYRCRTEKLSTKQTAYGAEYVRLVADAYIPVSEANKNLISTIDSGIKKEVSIGCGIGKCSCSICTENMRTGGCKHKKGKIYNGKVCCGILKSPTDAYEWAFVFKSQDEMVKKNDTAKKPRKEKWKRLAMDLICREYLSKCECCDECCSEFYCIENHLRSSRVPQNYCTDNLKAYLKERSKEIIKKLLN